MLLEVQNVSREFKRGDTPVQAVRDVTFSLDKGQFASVIGRSGSGKSTLVNLIVGLLKPSSGRILLRGTDLTALSDDEATRFRNAHIGYTPQGQSALSNLTVLENIRLPYDVYPREGSPVPEVERLLDRLGIGHLRDALPSSLSGGELRRAAIARALINAPDILVADEPTGDLDEKNTREIMKLFRDIADGGTAVLMVTHELDTTEYGDIVYRMEEGRLTRERRTTERTEKT